MTLNPKIRAWCIDVGERVGATFAEAFLAVFGVGGLTSLINGHLDRVLLTAAASAGVAAVLALGKGLLAAKIKGTVSPASLAPEQQPGQEMQDAPRPVDGTVRLGPISVRSWGSLANLPPPSGRKLGLRPLTTDRRDLKLARYLTSALPAPPAHVAWQQHVADFPMLLNDRIGDCVIAGMLHQQQVWAAAADNPTFTPTDAQALAMYRAITGYNPSDPSTDQGTDPRDALRYWQNTGAAGHKIVAYASVKPTDHPTVKTAINLFGGLGVCLNLPAYAETEHGKWLLKHGAGSAPGSWGGHWVCATGYDRHGIQLITWGEIWTLTWGFLDRYCDGLFAAISPDWMNAIGRTPTGLNLAALRADLAAIPT